MYDNIIYVLLNHITYKSETSSVANLLLAKSSISPSSPSFLNCRVSDPHFFFADPDPEPGKNLHADPDPDPGGIRGRGLGVKGKNDFF